MVACSRARSSALMVAELKAISSAGGARPPRRPEEAEELLDLLPDAVAGRGHRLDGRDAGLPNSARFTSSGVPGAGLTRTVLVIPARSNRRPRRVHVRQEAVGVRVDGDDRQLGSTNW